jgi:localization factor PodJL
MTSRVPWSVEEIEPSVRDRAEATARRAGMSLNDWLNSAIGDKTASAQPATGAADIHRRLDLITRQIEQMTRPPAPVPQSTTMARQLNDAIARLDAQLSQISSAAATPSRATSAPQPPASAYRQPAPTLPELLEFDVAEIVARQNQLDSEGRRTPPRAEAPVPPAPVAIAPDLSGFEQQLQRLTSQIESMRRPDGLDQAIGALRGELAEIRQVLVEALPRRALNALENEIRSVALRIEESRQNGVDGRALQNIEQALRNNEAALLKLMPAEQLAGFDDAIRNLGGKIDMMVRSDTGSLRQLEDAIGALRAISSNVASNDALARLGDEVKTLASKVDQLSESGGLAGASAAASTLAHVEQRIVQLLERLDKVDARTANFGRVEQSLTEILHHLEAQRASFIALGKERAPGLDPTFVDAIRRELSDMRISQSETDRSTQDALETVHNALGHVVDRLAMIEGDLRETRASRPAPHPGAHPAASYPTSYPIPGSHPIPTLPMAGPIISSTALSAPMPAPISGSIWPLGAAAPAASAPRPELPNPVARQDRSLASHMTDESAGHPKTARAQQPQRMPIDPGLPPDTPLEPGTRAQDAAAAMPAPAPTSSQRIAASESALSEIPVAPREATSASNFIAAARRAAQAASNPAHTTTSGRKAKPSLNVALEESQGTDGTDEGTDESGGSKTTSRIRSLLVGASVMVIVLGGFKIVMSVLATNELSPTLSIDKPLDRLQERLQEKLQDRSGNASAPAIQFGSSLIQMPASEQISPALTPAPIGQDQTPPVTSAAPPQPEGSNIAPPAAGPSPAAAPDVTGSLNSPTYRVPVVTDNDRKVAVAPPLALSLLSDTLPDTIGGPVLRVAALKGDPSAAYEVAVRYAEGKGVPVNYDEAAKWYDRASDGGIVPAMFRLGTLYEKGLGGRKDIDAARRYYIRAAEAGHAKAMHNLAVLDADGGNKGPNYKSAAQWFRKAAEHGVADSQFNLGILYARGIGVEQNLAESFKWFSLAAAQGDADSGRKRDDIVKRLDAQSLAAAKLAIQTFTIEGQPDEAVKVASPPAGWDAPPAATPAKRPVKSATSKLNTAATAATATR